MPSEEIHSFAFKEACSRYPNSIDALVFFASACGLFEGVLTMEHINWAREAAGFQGTSAAVVTEPSPLVG